MTHGFSRNGTTILFAALDVLEGTVLGRCMQRHRHQEFRRFLNTTRRRLARASRRQRSGRRRRSAGLRRPWIPFCHDGVSLAFAAPAMSSPLGTDARDSATL
jgi:hypothetical protein